MDFQAIGIMLLSDGKGYKRKERFHSPHELSLSHTHLNLPPDTSPRVHLTSSVNEKKSGVLLTCK